MAGLIAWPLSIDHLPFRPAATTPINRYAYFRGLPVAKQADPVLTQAARQVASRRLSPDRIHRALRLDKPGRVDFVPFLLRGNAVANRLGDCSIAGPVSQHALHVGLFQAEQAVAQLAIRGDAEPVAAHAERATDRSDEA